MRWHFGRVETVVVQRHLGLASDRELTEGFERSALSVLHAKGVRQWWDASKDAFSNLFSAWVDEKLASNLPRPIHAGLGLEFQRMRWRMGPPNQPLHSDALPFGRLWYTERDHAIGVLQPMTFRPCYANTFRN